MLRPTEVGRVLQILQAEGTRVRPRSFDLGHGPSYVERPGSGLQSPSAPSLRLKLCVAERALRSTGCPCLRATRVARAPLGLVTAISWLDPASFASETQSSFIVSRYARSIRAASSPVSALNSFSLARRESVPPFCWRKRNRRSMVRSGISTMAST